MKLKPIVDGIMDDFLHNTEHNDKETDYRKVTNILQSRTHSINIKHDGQYSVKFGKKFTTVPKLELKKDGIKCRISRPSSVKEPGSSIIYVDISFRPHNTRVNVDGNDLNYYAINQEFLYDVEDNLEHILKNASNYYNNLNDRSINQILQAIIRNLSAASKREDNHMNSYINIDA